MARIIHIAALLASTITIALAADATTTIVVQPTNSPQHTDDTTFKAAVINSTNFFRTQHSSPWAHWNETLATYAKEYLDDNDDCEFEHSGGPYGENLAMGYQDVQGAVDGWGLERKDYDFDKGEFSEKTGHFTSMVWKNSTTVGCARKACEGKGWFLVCEYWPTGNVIGAFKESVGRQINGTRGAATKGLAGSGSWMPAVVIAAAVVLGVMW